MPHESSATCACGGNCGCQNTQQIRHIVLTREEYVSRLERYLVDLKAEIEAVERELSELKGSAELEKASVP